MLTRQNLQDALKSDNVVAFLKMIRVGEGTSDVLGYNRIFGGAHFNSLADHPRIFVPFGKSKSSAAGAYQFLARTWDGLVKQYGFPDFSQECQDEGAVALIAGRNALDDVIAGRFNDAVRKCNREWASLPGSPYGQPTTKIEKARELYIDYGGVIA